MSNHDNDPAWLLRCAKMRAVKIQKLIRVRMDKNNNHITEKDVLKAIWHEAHCIVADEGPE